jgi:hypothetical protein
MPEIIQNALSQIRQLKRNDDGLFTADMDTAQVLALVIEAIKELDDNKRGAPKVSGSVSHKPNNFSVSDLIC